MSEKQDDREVIRDAVRERCDPKELIGFLASVASGEPVSVATAGDGHQVPDIRARVQAATWLLEAGWTKPTQPVEVVGGGAAAMLVPVSEMVAQLYRN